MIFSHACCFITKDQRERENIGVNLYLKAGYWEQLIASLLSLVSAVHSVWCLVTGL